MKIQVKFLADHNFSTFLTDTFAYWGILSPKSNVTVSVKEGEEMELIKVGENNDTEEIYIFLNEFIGIIPKNTFQIIS